MARRLVVSSLLLVLVLGAGGTLAAEEMPLETGSFQSAGSMAEARRDHSATLLPDGRVLVVGGFNWEDGPLASVHVWDPATGSFGAAGSLAEGRWRHTATLLPDGRVLVVGEDAAEVWDATTASFSPAGSIADLRPFHTATLLPDGRVLVVGGFDDDLIASTEVWDPATATFGRTGSLAEARWSHTATLLDDGRVLVVGGEGGADGYLGSAEVWEPGDG